MVGPLTYFARDPNRKGRGSGEYYHRGHGNFSKYSNSRDKRTRSKGYSSRKRGGRTGVGLYRHTDDRTSTKARKRGAKRGTKGSAKKKRRTGRRKKSGRRRKR